MRGNQKKSKKKNPAQNAQETFFAFQMTQYEATKLKPVKSNRVKPKKLKNWGTEKQKILQTAVIKI